MYYSLEVTCTTLLESGVYVYAKVTMSWWTTSDWLVPCH